MTTRDEFIDACKRVLDERESAPPYAYWFYEDTTDHDEGLSYCPDCIKKLMPDAEMGEHYTYSYPEGESDGCEHCEECGALLAYTLTDYGVESELEHFLENGWDWNNADDCYHVARVAYGIWAEGQKRQLTYVLRHGRNFPREILQEDSTK